jgi:hypothetical protein
MPFCRKLFPGLWIAAVLGIAGAWAQAGPPPVAQFDAASIKMA